MKGVYGSESPLIDFVGLGKLETGLRGYLTRTGRVVIDKEVKRVALETQRVFVAGLGVDEEEIVPEARMQYH